MSQSESQAPEEVHAKKRGRDGLVRAEEEMDQDDRKRLRGAKKAARRKGRKEKEVSKTRPRLLWWAWQSWPWWSSWS